MQHDDPQRERQPWRVQRMAIAHLRGMQNRAILPWLLAKLRAKGIRGAEGNPDRVAAAAVLRVLAGHPSLEAKLELLRAIGSMPDELRVLAVNSLARGAELDLVPTLVELLRDKEPNVRIAAANAIGTAMRPPHRRDPNPRSRAARSGSSANQAITKLRQLLVRDKVWQVRSAAAFAMAEMRCKAVIPALIKGLDAELKRKQDPWAMDVRLHKLLEGLTGQSVARGGIAPWKAFWRKEGASFTVRPQPAPGEAKQKNTRYETLLRT